MGEHSPPIKRIKHSSENFSLLNKDELIEIYQKQQRYIEELESKISNNSYDNDEKEKSSALQSNRREHVLVMRLASKEQEVQECIRQIHHIKKVQVDASLLSIRQANLDPGVNLLFGKMREELQQTKDKLEQAQSELSAWKFTPDSQNGKKLISRCRTLIAENQELGRQLSQGKSAQLEAELALQKKYSDELKVSQDELNEFVIQLDEEVEAMQSTIQVLQQQLVATRRNCEENKELIHQYEVEEQMKKDRLEEATNSSSYEETRASFSERDEAPSVSGEEYEVLSYGRRSPSAGSSYEEGEYISGCEVDYDNASVTEYNVDQLDEYEILETVPSETDENHSSELISASEEIDGDVKASGHNDRLNHTPPSPNVKNHKLSTDYVAQTSDENMTPSKCDKNSASRTKPKSHKVKDIANSGSVAVKSHKKRSSTNTDKFTNSVKGNEFMIIDQTSPLKSSKRKKSDSIDNHEPHASFNSKNDVIHASSKRKSSSSLRNHSPKVLPRRNSDAENSLTD